MLFYPIFVSCPKGLENILMLELQALGLENASNSPQGVKGDASLECIYQIALWSRIANRLHLVLCSGPAKNSDSLYQTCQAFAWHTIFSDQCAFKVQFHGTSDALRHEMYNGQVVKDAIVDHFRQHTGQRPNVEKDADIHIVAYLKYEQVIISLDLLGYSMHQRGYRSEQGVAPIKENLAAAMLWRMNWSELNAQGYDFADIMCGAGTIVIEAAMMAARMAPGLLRQDQAFCYWTQHQPSLWEKLQLEAKAQAITPHNRFFASDSKGFAVEQARANAARAGVANLIEFSQQPLQQVQTCSAKGLLLINPPYGERLGEQLDLIPLYQDIGKTLHQHFMHWEAGVLTSDPMLAKAIGLRAAKRYAFFNGSLPCQLYCITVNPENRLRPIDSGPTQMLANRLQKNLSHLQKWAKRQDIECYRVYDADIPEYAFAIDKYRDYFVIQEYMPPKTIPPHLAQQRRLDMMMLAPQVFQVSGDHIVFKERKPQKTEQYQKTDNQGHLMAVNEGQAKLLVNLRDYLDTGLFLDHRTLRLEFSKLPRHTTFLNLFCYTATASVHAGLAGASTVNVDLSKTYINWASENFKLNRLSPQQHRFVQADVMDWLQGATEQFDVIYMDAPSFSNSKRMRSTLDIQRDHVAMIRLALDRLHPGGILYFSTHLRSFQLDEAITTMATVENITRQTIDVDFKRDQKIHQCYKMIIPASASPS